MKIDYFSVPTVTRYRAGTLMVSPRPTITTPGKFANATTIKNNYFKNTAAGQILNAIINQIDGIYQTFSSTLKATWQAAAATIPTAVICGCNFQSIDGQKLHRAVNLYNQMNGIAFVTSPPSTSAWAPGELVLYLQENNPPQPVTRTIFAVAPQSSDQTLLIRMSKGIKSPQFHIPAGVVEIFILPGDPFFNDVHSVPLNTTIGWCLSYTNGLPNSSGTILVQAF